MSEFDALAISERGGALPCVRFSVRVQPRSSRTGIDGVRGDALLVRVNAPPVEGAANEAVIEVLAKFFRVAKRAVTITSGESSRAKTIQIDGVTAAQLKSRLEIP